MSNELTIKANSAMIEKVVVGGDLSTLAPAERLSYYSAVCESLGLNPLTKPFDYIRLNNKLVLYAKRDCTDQLRDKRKINITIPTREKVDDVYIVTAKATMPDGRTDESIGAVNISGLKGDALANALMKAETKAKRRVTLSIVGLGWLDELEVETIPDARPEIINVETGEVTTKEPPRVNGKAKTEEARPFPPSIIRLKLNTQILKGNYKDNETGEFLPINLHRLGDKTAGILSKLLESAFPGDKRHRPDTPEAMRHTVTHWLFGVQSAKELTASQANALLVWLTGREAPGFDTPLNSFVPTEARAIYEQALTENKANEMAEGIMGDTPWDELATEAAPTEGELAF